MTRRYVLVICMSLTTLPLAGSDDARTRSTLTFTTDNFTKVDVEIAKIPGGQNPKLELQLKQFLPLIQEETRPNEKRWPPVTFRGDSVVSIRVNDWMKDGVMCVFVVSIGDKCEYRWATWSKSAGGNGVIRASPEMARHRCNVIAAWNDDRNGGSDSLNAIFRGTVEGATATSWYQNHCASYSDIDDVDVGKLVPLGALKGQAAGANP